jgi:hypothetical protein
MTSTSQEHHMTTTDTTRDFGLGAVLSITDGALLCNTVTVWSDLAAWIDRQTDTDTGRTDDA